MFIYSQGMARITKKIIPIIRKEIVTGKSQIKPRIKSSIVPATVPALDVDPISNKGKKIVW